MNLHNQVMQQELLCTNWLLLQNVHRRFMDPQLVFTHDET